MYRPGKPLLFFPDHGCLVAIFIRGNVHYLLAELPLAMGAKMPEIVNQVIQVHHHQQKHDDANSFFVMGLEFLMENSDNIKRQNNINGGIYEAKKIKGRYIKGGKPPYGYKKVRIQGGKDSIVRLVADETEAEIVHYIFGAFMSDTPTYIIKETAKQLGFNRSGNSTIDFILRNPIYYGYQYVKPWQNNPGGCFP